MKRDEPHLMTAVVGGMFLLLVTWGVTDAWRHAADQQLRAVQIQIDYDREMRENSLERLFRGSWKGGCL